jgi:hypothetical protein
MDLSDQGPALAQGPKLNVRGLLDLNLELLDEGAWQASLEAIAAGKASGSGVEAIQPIRPSTKSHSPATLTSAPGALSPDMLAAAMEPPVWQPRQRGRPLGSGKRKTAGADSLAGNPKQAVDALKQQLQVLACRGFVVVPGTPGAWMRVTPQTSFVRNACCLSAARLCGSQDGHSVDSQCIAKGGDQQFVNNTAPGGPMPVGMHVCSVLVALRQDAADGYIAMTP